MSKDLIRALICFLVLVLASSSMARMPLSIVSGGGGGCTIPGSPDIEASGTSSLEAISGSPSNAEGQSFDSGAGGQLAKICIYAEDTDGYGETSFDLRIGPDKDLTSTYMEEWSSGEISGIDWRCFDSVDNDTFTGSTTYYWGVIETAGQLKIGFDTDSITGNKIWNGTEWNMGSNDLDYDMSTRIYWCD